MRAISVKFDGYGPQYTYLTSDYTIKVGDECVVITPTGTKIVEVYQVDCPKGKATKPIVCKVDVDGYEDAIDRMARAAQVEAAIEERVAYLTKTVQLEELAKKDPILASLLNQRSRGA